MPKVTFKRQLKVHITHATPEEGKEQKHSYFLFHYRCNMNEDKSAVNGWQGYFARHHVDDVISSGENQELVAVNDTQMDWEAGEEKVVMSSDDKWVTLKACTQRALISAMKHLVERSNKYGRDEETSTISGPDLFPDLFADDDEW